MGGDGTNSLRMCKVIIVKTLFTKRYIKPGITAFLYSSLSMLLYAGAYLFESWERGARRWLRRRG